VRERLVRRAKILDAITAARVAENDNEFMRSAEAAILDIELMDLEVACRLEEITH
jgi:hypothetical protein